MDLSSSSCMILFDCLATKDLGPILDRPLTERRAALEGVAEQLGRDARVRVTPFTHDRQEAERWLARAQDVLDGIVAKRTDEPYTPGARAMLKVKHWRTADCVVGGFRHGRGRREVGSLLLGLFDPEGRLNYVGFTSAISGADRSVLTSG